MWIRAHELFFLFAIIEKGVNNENFYALESEKLFRLIRYPIRLNRFLNLYLSEKIVIIDSKSKVNTNPTDPQTLSKDVLSSSTNLTNDEETLAEFNTENDISNGSESYEQPALIPILSPNHSLISEQSFEAELNELEEMLNIIDIR